MAMDFSSQVQRRSHNARGLDAYGTPPAAICCGSYRDSVADAVAIIKTQDPNLLTGVLSGRTPLLHPARVELIDAFRGSSDAERLIFARVVSPEKLFDVAA